MGLWQIFWLNLSGRKPVAILTTGIWSSNRFPKPGKPVLSPPPGLLTSSSRCVLKVGVISLKLHCYICLGVLWKNYINIYKKYTCSRSDKSSKCSENRYNNCKYCVYLKVTPQTAHACINYIWKIGRYDWIKFKLSCLFRITGQSYVSLYIRWNY